MRPRSVGADRVLWTLICCGFIEVVSNAVFFLSNWKISFNFGRVNKILKVKFKEEATGCPNQWIASSCVSGSIAKYFLHFSYPKQNKKMSQKRRCIRYLNSGIKVSHNTRPHYKLCSIKLSAAKGHLAPWQILVTFAWNIFEPGFHWPH